MSFWVHENLVLFTIQVHKVQLYSLKSLELRLFCDLGSRFISYGYRHRCFTIYDSSHHSNDYTSTYTTLILINCTIESYHWKNQVSPCQKLNHQHRKIKVKTHLVEKRNWRGTLKYKFCHPERFSFEQFGPNSMVKSGWCFIWTLLSNYTLLVRVSGRSQRMKVDGI